LNVDAIVVLTEINAVESYGQGASWLYVVNPVHSQWFRMIIA